MNSAHLGGHFNKTHLDEGSLTFMIKEFNIKSFLDIGCGPMGMVNVAKKLGLDAFGIDGDPKLYFKENFLKHDFTDGPAPLQKKFDLAWSVEFLEHVEEKFIKNYMEAFKLCRFCFITHALPNKKGYHHVNCKDEQYWIDIFQNYGFYFDDKITKNIKNNSTMKREFVKKTGKFFTNKFI
ncbi:MAG: class I SAM-dependent methyltransferase [Bacteroidetes bacterium]|nr:class I SAM-dependent methyltransferase [Bacteroidota bacterium]